MSLDDFPSQDAAEIEQAQPAPLSWAVLLGHWMDFAQRALALPDDADGRRMREAVPELITLQAVWFALQQIEALDAEQRALGLDRAEILIEKHAGSLSRRWAPEALPPMIDELIADARAELARAVEANR